ncbi:hypothetical protein EV126DRAFT_409517 [Verticillium dahliae]|nr:hypothetical protein EV126DRAFT_409517 [Verticillium dahliae]
MRRRHTCNRAQKLGFDIVLICISRESSFFTAPASTVLSACLPPVDGQLGGEATPSQRIERHTTRQARIRTALSSSAVGARHVHQCTHSNVHNISTKPGHVVVSHYSGVSTVLERAPFESPCFAIMACFFDPRGGTTFSILGGLTVTAAA